jgi:excisionase family DNA binding protein
MTVSDVASLLRVSRMTVYRLLQAGELTSVRVGRSSRLRRANVAEYLHRSQLGGPEEPAPHGHHRAGNVHAARLPTAADGAPRDAADRPPVRTSPWTPHNTDPPTGQRLAPRTEELTGNRLDADHPARQARMFLSLARAALAAERWEIAEELLEPIYDIAGELPAELVVEHLELGAALRAASTLGLG